MVSTIRDRDDGAPFVGPHGTSPTPAGWTAPLPVLKLLASSIGIIGGLALFGLLFGRLLDPRPSAAFASASLRRRRDPPAGTESDT